MQLQHHQRYVIEEFAEDYQEKKMSRRELMRRSLLITGSIPITASLLFALGCGDDASEDEPAAPTSPPVTPVATTAAGIGPGVSETDPAIQTATVKFQGPASDLIGYLARPVAPGSYPGVIVIHENQGLLDHFKDVARRFAKEGFVALSVDLVSRLGGTSATDPSVNMMALRASRTDLVADLVGYTNYLKTQPFVKATALGVTGYCFGGGYTWELAAASPDIKAAAPYYGSVSPEALELLPSSKAAFIAMYGADDTRITGQEPMVKEKLASAGKVIETKIYPGAPHAFFNETKPNSYNEAAAKDAWTQTLAWFRKYLVG